MTKGVDLGLLSAKEYRDRRSKTLTDNPRAVLDELKEIDAYLNKLDLVYRDEIATLANLDTQPMLGSCRFVVTVIALGEEKRIENTLDQFLAQDLDKDSFEIIVLENHPKNLSKDGTENVINSFKEKNPSLHITYANKAWQTKQDQKVGNARKYSCDIALTRIQDRNKYDQDTIIAFVDADTIEIKTNYLSSILKQFDNNKKLDALVAQLAVPLAVVKKPNMFATLSLWDALEETIVLDDVGLELQEPKAPTLVGSAISIRASVYAAVGGINKRAVLAEDTELSWAIGDARAWDPYCIKYFNGTTIFTDPRRHLSAMANRVPIIEMMADFETNTEIRNANNKELLKHISEDLDWELFESDADAFWQARHAGMYQWIKKRFKLIFERTMEKIGVEFEFEKDRVKLKNIDKLIENYQKAFGKKIKIIHSAPIIVDPEQEKRSKEYFYSISSGIIEARKRQGLDQ
jgi:hypothetical protein